LYNFNYLLDWDPQNGHENRVKFGSA
jgi:hypothetical protein